VRDVFGNQGSNPNERVVAISDVGAELISKLEVLTLDPALSRTFESSLRPYDPPAL